MRIKRVSHFPGVYVLWCEKGSGNVGPLNIIFFQRSICLFQQSGKLSTRNTPSDIEKGSRICYEGFEECKPENHIQDCTRFYGQHCHIYRVAIQTHNS